MNFASDSCIKNKGDITQLLRVIVHHTSILCACNSCSAKARGFYCSILDSFARLYNHRNETNPYH